MKEINQYMDGRYTQFLDGIGKVNENLYQKILEYLIEYSHGGVLKYSTELALLEDKIKEILAGSGYKKESDEFMKSTEVIEQMNIARYRLQGLSQNLKKSNRLKVAKDIMFENLKGAGIEENVVRKLSNELRTAVVNGITYKDARVQLTQLMSDNGVLPRYIHQVSTDMLGQYNGSIQADIIENYEPKGFYWVGDPIDTSRPLTLYLEEKFGSDMITFEEMKKVLDEFCPNGKPSEVMITITTPISGKERTLKKGSGMIEGTTIKTFPIYRGGYESRYSVDLVF